MSIILPFRNEEKELQQTLEVMLAQEFEGQFEIICVDDNSEDGSTEIIADLEAHHTNLRCIRSNGHGKKSALTRGITEARHDWILTVDADTLFAAGWLRSIMHHAISNGNIMCLGPVSGRSNTPFESAVALEFAALSGTGLGSANAGLPIMANGANLLFSKQAFNDVQGYSGNERIASGDDVFLLRKFHAAGLDIGVCLSSEAIGKTRMPENGSELLSQRIRWGSKNQASGSILNNVLLFTVIAANLSIVLGTVAWCVGSLPASSLFIPWIIKALIDLAFLWQVLTLTKQLTLLRWFPFMTLAYPFYLVVISLLSLLMKTEWKGRPIVSK